MSDRPVVVVADRQSHTTLDARRWGDLAGDVLAASGVTSGELSLLFVDDDEMRRLNSLHMSIDSPTDVLAFPLDGGTAVQDASLIGDVVVCPAVASADVAAARAASPSGQLCSQTSSPAACSGSAGENRAVGNSAVDDRIALLVVHGILHVLGHDHADDAEAEAMQALEHKLLAEHYCRRRR